MNISEAIDLLKDKTKNSMDKKDQQLLQWLLELRTLRAQLKALDEENERLAGSNTRNCCWRAKAAYRIFCNSSLSNGTIVNRSPTIP